MKTALALLALASQLQAARLKDWALVHSKMLLLDITDSRVELSMPGRPAKEKVVIEALDLEKAARPGSWKLNGAAALRVGRKSKGNNYLMQHDPWGISHGMEHFIYLEFSESLKEGGSYSLEHGGLLEGGPIQFSFQSARTRSESIHVNQVGYTEEGPKLGFLSQWAGDMGALDFSAWDGKPFKLLEAQSRKAAFEGVLKFRKGATEPDSGIALEGNHLRSPLWAADFSAFQSPGSYVLSVEGLGCSYPFQIGKNAYRSAFITSMRGLYHQRCGTPLKKPWGAYERAACHAPDTGHILQSKIRRMDRQCDACKDVQSTGEIRDIAGGWHDAGDWDREDWHFLVPTLLSFIYEMAPQNFKDGELLIPEAGNGLPDILDEAKWGLDYWRRSQRKEGGVGVGMFLDSFPDPGEAAETCSAKRYLYAEDPQASYRYSAAACHFAFALEKAGRKGEGAPWLASGRKAWDWAEKNQRPGDFEKVRDDRLHAAACLWRATGEAGFHQAFVKDLKVNTPETPLSLWQSHDQNWAVISYLSAGEKADPKLRALLSAALRHFARSEYLEPAAKRGMGGAANWWRPMVWGGLTQPEDLPLLASALLLGDAESKSGLEAALGLALGANPLNICYISGLGSHQPTGIFHPDSWMHLGDAHVAPGIMAMGPSAYDKEGDPKSGPWEPSYTLLSFYPPAKSWPPLECYADARICFPMNEFTVLQIATLATQFAALAGPAN